MPFSVKKSLFLLSFTAFIVGEANTALARWATYDDAEIKIENTQRTIYINKEGMGHEVYEVRAKLLKENAKKTWANYTDYYNSTAQNLKILEAYTLTNGQKYPVDLKKITKHSITPGNDADETKIIIPFPNLKIGSVVYFKSKKTKLQSQLNKLYSACFHCGNKLYTETSNAYVVSELPLHISIHDPDKILSVKKSTTKQHNKTLHLLEIHQKKPIYKHIIEEDKVHFNLKNIPMVCIWATPTATHSDRVMATEYTKIKNQALPHTYQEIANMTKTKSDVFNKIDTVTSLLHKNITYTINSNYCSLPQPLEQAANTHRGDCKDFCVATCAILRAIGISAKVASVRDGERILPFPSSLTGYGFNHVIVKVELPDRTLWVDPTYPASLAKYIPANIANRKARVLQENHVTYEDIPPIKSEEYRLIKQETWDMKNLSQVQIKGRVKLLGAAASPFTGKRNFLSEEQIKKMLLSSIITNDHEILNYDITLPDLSDQIMEDLLFEYTMTIKIPEQQIKEANALPVSLKKNLSLLIARENAVSSIYLGPPRIFETYITLDNIISSENNDLNAQLDSPWVKASRTVLYEKEKAQIIIHKKMEIKKSWVEDTELVSKAYTQLKLDIDRNFSKDNLITIGTTME